MTCAAVFSVIIYRITISALMAMSPDPEVKSNVRVTVTATAVIINLVVILILDEIYGMVAAWLTELGEILPLLYFFYNSLCITFGQLISFLDVLLLLLAYPHGMNL